MSACQRKHLVLDHIHLGHTSSPNPNKADVRGSIGKNPGPELKQDKA